MSAALKKLDGVGSVEVSLEKSTVAIALEPENKITLPLLRRTIRSNGNDTKDAAITARGRLVGAGDAFALDLLNGSTLPVARAPRAASDTIVEIIGISRADDKNVEQLTVNVVK